MTVRGITWHLTPTESKLLHVLAVQAGEVCPTDRIVTHLWGESGEGDASLIKTHIRHLGQKIEGDP